MNKIVSYLAAKCNGHYHLGSTVRLFGLENEKSQGYNGRIARIKKEHPSDDRYAVQILPIDTKHLGSLKEIVKVRPLHIKPIPPKLHDIPFNDILDNSLIGVSP